jgi:hypothetical protein
MDEERVDHIAERAARFLIDGLELNLEVEALGDGQHELTAKLTLRGDWITTATIKLPCPSS